jgi:hypothetical protein
MTPERTKMISFSTFIHLPALLIRTSSFVNLPRNRFAHSRTDFNEARSNNSISTLLFPDNRHISFNASSARFRSRQARITCAPI